jgi:hypothetical protein
MMNEFDEEDFSNFSVNLEKVVKDKNSSSITKLLAAKLMVQPYMSIGEFLNSLSDDDVAILLDMVEEEELENILLITEMLAGSEGLGGSKDVEESTIKINAMANFIVLESLARKGLIKLHRENLSFGEDMQDKLIAERI